MSAAELARQRLQDHADPQLSPIQQRGGHLGVLGRAAMEERRAGREVARP
jgi:hypothetical protein